MALLSPSYLKTIIAIGALDKRKRFVCQATGFFVGFLTKNSKDPAKRLYNLFILTNRHVFENKNEVHLRFNIHGGKSKIILQPLKFPNGQARWLVHPNKKVDLALLNIDAAKLKKKGIDYTFFNEEMFTYHRNFVRTGIAIGDSTYILGFPMGFAGIVQNFPYAKAGIISRFDRELLKDQKAFLIDSSIFPGNSGGPVTLEPTTSALPKTKAVATPHLIGVVSRYLPYEEQLWSHQTTPPSVVSLEREHSGLSFVVPMDYAKQIFNRWIKAKKQLAKAQKQKIEQEIKLT